MKLIIILLSTVFIYPNEGDLYTFIVQHNLDDPISKYRTESMLDFAFGSYQNSMNSDYKVTEKYLGEKDGFLLIEKTFLSLEYFLVPSVLSYDLQLYFYTLDLVLI